jgi:16S rRNA (guanine527-N7)-methyltransferase
VHQLHVLTPGEKTRLVSALSTARDRGFLGPGPVDEQLERSLAFGRLAGAGCRALDLGSGGGLPGLALALALPGYRWNLVDSNGKRAEWLRTAIGLLEVDERCQVSAERAEQLAQSALRGAFDLVTARSFGPPAATAECAAAFLRQGGHLIVAEPPSGACGRWPASGLATLGLSVPRTEVVTTAAGPVTLSLFVADALCPSRYPRRTGVPFKRPLF